MSTIDLRNVTKHFGAFTAVKDLSLSVSAGEVVCLLGPSGCGKTTTLRIVAGLERASAGDVVIAGKRMNDLRPDQRNIAMVFQFYALYGLNLDVPAGRFFVLFGPSAVGKTTTLRAVSGLVRPDCGSIRIGDRDVTDAPIKGRGVSMVFQSFALYPHLTVFKYLAYPLSRGRRPVERRHQAGSRDGSHAQACAPPREASPRRFRVANSNVALGRSW